MPAQAGIECLVTGRSLAAPLRAFELAPKGWSPE
jgi:hypothetical protein